jgi:hypothetical protein
LDKIAACDAVTGGIFLVGFEQFENGEFGILEGKVKGGQRLVLKT